MKTRYFLISYSWSKTNGEFGFGNILNYGENFPNQDQINNFLKEENRINASTILNIFEFKTKKDFEEFKRSENDTTTP